MAGSPAGGSWPGVVMDGRLVRRWVVWVVRSSTDSVSEDEASSVQAKSLLAHIASEVRARREVSVEEAHLIALDAYRFLERGLLRLGPGQVELPCIAGRESHLRRARRDQPEKLVRVSIVADEDASLLEEFGTRIMQRARIARVIEEAYDQDALLDGERLCLLVPLTLTAIRERLKVLREEGCRLPISGMTRRMREGLKAPRAVLAMERYLDGEEVGELRRRLGISRMRWQEWYSAFSEVAARCDLAPAVLSQEVGYPEEYIRLWQELWRRCRDSPKARERMGRPALLPRTRHYADEEDRLLDRLLYAHGYTPASARSFIQELRDLAFRIRKVSHKPGQIVTFGVSETEPPGRSLAEAQLLMVALDYVAP